MSDHGGAVYGKIAWHVLPLVLAGYIVAYVDRVNIGFAKLQFASDLHFSEQVFGLARRAVLHRLHAV